MNEMKVLKQRLLLFISTLLVLLCIFAIDFNTYAMSYENNLFELQPSGSNSGGGATVYSSNPPQNDYAQAYYYNGGQNGVIWFASKGSGLKTYITILDNTPLNLVHDSYYDANRDVSYFVCSFYTTGNSGLSFPFDVDTIEFNNIDPYSSSLFVAFLDSVSDGSISGDISTNMPDNPLSGKEEEIGAFKNLSQKSKIFKNTSESNLHKVYIGFDLESTTGYDLSDGYCYIESISASSGTVPPHDYFSYVRISNSVNVQLNTYYKISDIASMLGVDSIGGFHFDKLGFRLVPVVKIGNTYYKGLYSDLSLNPSGTTTKNEVNNEDGSGESASSTIGSGGSDEAGKDDSTIISVGDSPSYNWDEFKKSANGILEMVGNIPSIFSRLFSFLPSWVLALFSFVIAFLLFGIALKIILIIIS